MRTFLSLLLSGDLSFYVGNLRLDSLCRSRVFVSGHRVSIEMIDASTESYTYCRCTSNGINGRKV